ncbi:hypothetical protein PR002_g4099 [Phytophthora rubi]|uniref:HAT C-terminal dimerisation domain-containing protein n=1 Tax=Phytophthora rubi TaxID=129364 RepID=A0A6A3NCM6_9STRA|nr:hypothetical protein PR002_g4099 [Phytophthora rubi]
MFLQLSEEFKKMEIPISELDKIQQIVDESFNIVYVAYLLDPRYLGQGMYQETRGSVQEFIANWHGSGEEEATTVELVKYLGGHRSTSLEAELIRQKQMTVAQAVAERNWSAHKLVHSQARNRLEDKSVEKQVFLFFNAKNFDSDDLAFYDMTEDLEANISEEEDNNEDSDYEYYCGQ